MFVKYPVWSVKTLGMYVTELQKEKNVTHVVFFCFLIFCFILSQIYVFGRAAKRPTICYWPILFNFNFNHIWFKLLQNNGKSHCWAKGVTTMIVLLTIHFQHCNLKKTFTISKKVLFPQKVSTLLFFCPSCVCLAAVCRLFYTEKEEIRYPALGKVHCQNI